MEILSTSPVMHVLQEQARRVAATSASVLIYGESGTGKELLARSIHDDSERHGRPFVPVNCGAIPDTLFEAELFGHAKGAFTGAIRDHPGLFRQAEGGTLFLDEIGDMPLAIQVKILRVLQEREVRAVGAVRSQPVDVRIISATHRDLSGMVAEGAFREDLLYRLDVVSLSVPPLRERPADIPMLAMHFLEEARKRYRCKVTGFTVEALALLCDAAWPGNVRQLANVVEKCCILSPAVRIGLPLVQQALGMSGIAYPGLDRALQHFERDYLVRLLEICSGNIALAARMAGRNRTGFYRLLRRHQLA